MSEHPELDPALNWTCGFSPDGPLECLDVATWHGFRLTDDGLRIDAMMAACGEHRARMLADYEHPMQSACGILGSRFRWPEGDSSAVLVGEAELVEVRRG